MIGAKHVCLNAECVQRQARLFEGELSQLGGYRTAPCRELVELCLACFPGFSPGKDRIAFLYDRPMPFLYPLRLGRLSRQNNMAWG
jgi:hypothetical protein